MIKSPAPEEESLTTMDAARQLGLAVRSVQLMVDRAELEAWKTPGGHRRISAASVRRWQAQRGMLGVASRGTTALLIEDSVHYQRLIRLLVEHHRIPVDLHVAEDGIAGLVEFGRLQPDILIVDLLLPGIDGGSLIAGLRTREGFDPRRLIVVTSLEPDQRAPFEHALTGVAVVHKPMLAVELPGLLTAAIGCESPKSDAGASPAVR